MGRISEDAVTFRADPTRESAHGRRPARILVVEDDALVRMTAGAILEDAGYQVVEAEGAEAALRLVEDEPGGFTHVFTDVQMPGRLDGLKLARLLATQFPHIVVVVTSGDHRLEKDAAAQFFRFVRKPWNAIDILNIVTPAA
jgi:two-component system, response regulator PdtaR